MKFLMFIFLAGCAVKCDDGGNYYVIEMPEPTISTNTAPNHSHHKLRVYWNVPTNQCRSKRIPFENLQQFGIIQNDNDDFRGDQIVIFYDPGLFPAIFQNQTSGKLRYRNGGVPQEGDLDEHLKSFRNVVNQTIPDANFGGIAIIDFESWRPIFRQNWGDIQLYKEVSYKIERNKHWFWPNSWIYFEAKERFEKAARIFMQNTISVAKRMRPHAVWGYYGFPYCFNMAGNHMSEPCADRVDAENDQIFWLWLESTGLYPSVYSSTTLNSNQLGKMIRGRIQEAARVRKPGTPILPYFWFKYREGDFLREIDLHTALQTFNQSEASGFIIWGSSNDVNTVEKCQKLHNYIYTVFGPTIAKYAKSINKIEDEMDNVTGIRLEDVTTDDYFDVTTPEMTSSTTDSTNDVTDEDIDISTVTTEDTVSHSNEDHQIVAMKSLIDILLNQILEGDGAEYEASIADSKNKNGVSEKKSDVVQCPVYNWTKISTNTVTPDEETLSKDLKKGKVKNRTLLILTGNISTETYTESLGQITIDNWTTLITDERAKLEPVEDVNIGTNITNPENLIEFSEIDESSTESISQSTSDSLLTETSTYLESVKEDLSNEGKPKNKTVVTTKNITSETHTKELLQRTLSDLSSVATDESTYLETHVGEDLSKDTKKGKPKTRTVLTTTENINTETFTETTVQSATDTLTSTLDIGSIYSKSPVEEHVRKDNKKGKPRNRTNDIKNYGKPVSDSNDIFFNQDSLFIQDNSNTSKLEDQNGVYDYKKHGTKDRKKGLPEKLLNKTEVNTSNSITTTESGNIFDRSENKHEFTEATIEDIVQDDVINKDKSTNIHPSTVAVTSHPESLTSGTSDQVVVRII